MERRNSKEWIKSLKIAIINRDLEKLEEYSQRKIPEFSSIEEARKAFNLVQKAMQIIQKEKERIGRELQIFKQTQKYNNYFQTSTTSFQA